MDFKLYFQKFTELGFHPDDSDEEKVNKSSLTVLSAPFAIAGLVWGLLYFINGLTLPGSIPFSYGILSILSLINFRITKKYRVFRNSQLLLILILPFLLQLSLGGFVASSAVIIWALISPIGALVFFKTKGAVTWFVAYVILVVVAFFVNDFVLNKFNWELSSDFVNVVFLLNIVAVSSLIWAILFHFVRKQTELKKSIEDKSLAMQHQAEKLKELDEAKSRFFANISHEFRTPLTIIMGLTQKQLANPDKVINVEDLETVTRNADRLLQLINQLLDLSKLESGELQLKVAKSDIMNFVKIHIQQFESLATDRTLNILLNGQKPNNDYDYKEILVYFDQDKIQKVVTNLMSNAMKFAREHTSVLVNIVANKNTVSISVSNTGEGIHEEKLAHVFDRFYQADTGSTRQYEGTGIGLALVKELVEFHYGEVKAESASDLTTFSIRLPMDENIYKNDPKVIIEETKTEISATPIDSKKAVIKETAAVETNLTEEIDQLEILIVEDNADLRKYIGGILESDYNVKQAVNGQEGVEMAIESIPDLIISDVMMPLMDGFELCESLKTNEKTNHIPIVLLTAKASMENKIDGLNTGADDYLVKPFDEKELLVRVRNLITIRGNLQKKYQRSAFVKPGNVNVTSVQEKFIENLKEIIEQNIDNSEFSVEDLGKEIGMSRSQIHRKLKALTDQSATKYIRNYRLHKAAELIKQDTGNITEIAYDVGFSSQTYFSSSFQELFKCSPSEYKATYTQTE